MKEAEGYSSVVALAEEHFEEGLGKPACLSFSCSLDLPLETIFSTKYKYIKIGRRQLVVFKVHGGSKKIFG